MLGEAGQGQPWLLDARTGDEPVQSLRTGDERELQAEVPVLQQPGNLDGAHAGVRELITSPFPMPPAPSPAPSWTAERTATLVLWTALAVGGALRAWLALTDAGIYWPDEIYQSLEPAHRLVWGRGLVAWEFLDGARPWTLPALVAAFWTPLRLLGVSSPDVYVPAVKLL